MKIHSFTRSVVPQPTTRPVRVTLRLNEVDLRGFGINSQSAIDDLTRALKRDVKSSDIRIRELQAEIKTLVNAKAECVYALELLPSLTLTDA